MSDALLIGSGDWHWQGWVTLDGDPTSGADFIAEVPPLPVELRARRYHTILASHFIEHLLRVDALALLKECYALLDSDGMLVLEQPDLAYCCKVVAGVIDPPPGRSVEQFGFWGIFGRPELHPMMGHKWGYTPETLTDLVVEAGFVRERITIAPGVYHEPTRDFTLKAVR